MDLLNVHNVLQLTCLLTNNVLHVAVKSSVVLNVLVDRAVAHVIKLKTSVSKVINVFVSQDTLSTLQQDNVNLVMSH